MSRVEDTHRLAAVRGTGLLDSPPEEAYDRITRTAARLTGAPISLISLVDERRQFFKSSFGLAGELAAARGTPLTHSFCRHVVETGRPLVVADARAHPLVVSNPAIAEHGFMAYAGLPLTTEDGHTVGSLCLIDLSPRDWSPQELELLEDVRKGVMRELELRLEVRARRRLNDALLATEAQQRAVLEDIRDVVFQADTAGVWTFLNAAWWKLTGHSVAESIGHSAFEYIHPDDRVHVAAASAPMLAGESDSVEYEHRWLTVDGEERWCSVRAHAKLDPHGLVCGIAGVMTDVTERRRYDEARREAERLKNEFFALVSHELRTPLTSIAGYLELLTDEEERAAMEEADERHFLHAMQRNTSRLERLVGDLLFVAQLEAGQLSLERRRAVDLGELALAAVEAAARRAEPRDVRIELESCDIGELTGDPERLEQVLDNLLSNALKCTPDGGRVVVRGRCVADRALLEVADTGIGIPAAELPFVFERFYRATTATEREIPGAGLGLSVCKAIVEGHGGTISVESAEGAGTVFAVELPRVPAV